MHPMPDCAAQINLVITIHTHIPEKIAQLFKFYISS